jgi:transcriptional regulator with XRE-family HTH domain
MLNHNLKYLRKKKGISQEQLANVLDIAKTTLGDYERGKYEPSISTLITLADYFDVSIDGLLRKDLKHEDYEIIRNKDFRVLAITVDNENNENIELVDTKAEAGYIESFNDPEYIRDLPKIYFPNIPEGTYRGFEIRGDSMLPMEPGNVVICSYVENMEEIKDGKTYVVISKSGGLVYKRIRFLKKENALLMISDNDIYSPYLLPLDDIAEIWEYYAHIGISDPKQLIEQMLDERITDIQNKVREIHLNLTI